MHTLESVELERELTYLAREVPREIENVVPVQMEDTYFPEDPQAHAQLRVRKSGDKYMVTKKVPTSEDDASVQLETTIPLSASEYTSLSSGSNRKVSKDRYHTMINGYPAQVDVFKDSLNGLVVIDFEFDSEEAQANFTPPDCCLADVTQEEFIAGGVLSGKSYDDLSEDLARLGYVRLEVNLS